MRHAPAALRLWLDSSFGAVVVVLVPRGGVAGLVCIFSCSCRALLPHQQAEPHPHKHNREIAMVEHTSLLASRFTGFPIQ